MADTTSSSYGSRAELMRWADPAVLKMEGSSPTAQIIVLGLFVTLAFVIPVLMLSVGDIFTETYDEYIGGKKRLEGMNQRTKLEKEKI